MGQHMGEYSEWLYVVVVRISILNSRVINTYVCLDSNDMYPVPPEPAANRNNRCFFPSLSLHLYSSSSFRELPLIISLFELRRLLLRLCFLIGHI